MPDTPAPPSHIGNPGQTKMPDGRKLDFKIEDEVITFQSTDPQKSVCIQKIRFEEDQRLEYRFTYYYCRDRGEKFGQYSLFVPPEDLAFLLTEARARGWEGI